MKSLLTPMFGTLMASATILIPIEARAQCTLDAINLTFDNYDVFSKHDTVGVGHVYVTCDLGVRYTITFSTGNSNTYSSRKLVTTHGGSLKYNLSAYPNAMLAWDNATGGYRGIGTGTRQSIPIYARIAAGQTHASVGVYTDTITAILTTR